MSFGFIFAKQWNSLARPPTGLHPINRVSGAGWSRHTCISKGFHVSSRSLHFYISFLGWKLFSFVFRAAIAYRYCTIKSHNGISRCRQYKFQNAVWVCYVTLARTMRPCIHDASGQRDASVARWCQIRQILPKSLFSKNFANFSWQYFLMPKTCHFLKYQLWL